MTTQLTTQETEGRGKRRSGLLLTLGLGAALAALVAMIAGTAQQAEAALTQKIVFVSDRTTGVDNPTGDFEIFTMNPDGMGVKQLTFNAVDEYDPTLSPDGTKIAYESRGDQTSNPEGDNEVYVMNALNGTDQINLTNNGLGVDDYDPVFSPRGAKIAYWSEGAQTSNPEGDDDIYVMRTLDGSGKKNLTHNGDGINDFFPDFSPGGKKIAYNSQGVQSSNPQGDREVYVMNTPDGTGKKNLTHNSVTDHNPDFSPDGKMIAYWSESAQTSNPEGDREIYVMNPLDGTGKKNLTHNGDGVNDHNPEFSPSGKKILYTSYGKQTSNREGEDEVYRMNAVDGTDKRNLSNNGLDVYDVGPDFSPDGTKVVYVSSGVQTSNPEGDAEVYVMKALDGTGKKNLSNNGLEVGRTYPVFDDSPEWGR